MANAGHDQNHVATLTALSSANDGTIVALWADPTTHRLLVDASSGITIGTTTITGGTNTRVLYDNAGVVGEYTISGTGSVAMTTSPTFVTPTLGAASGTSLNLSGLTASQAVVTDASKNLASLAYSQVNTNSALVQRTSNGDALANNFVSTSTATVTAGQTITMTAGSSRVQKTTGTSTATFKLPDATTLVNGWNFEFNNNSTGTVTIQDSAAGAVTTVPGGGYAYLICTDNSTAAGVWDYHFQLPSTSTAGTTGLTITGFINATTGFRVNGSATSGAILIGNGTNLVLSTATFPNSATTDGQLLIGNTSTGNWTASTITAGTGITVTNAGGSITIAASGGSSSSKLAVLTSVFTNNNSNTETDVIANTSVTAGSLSAGRAIRFEFYVKCQSNSSSETWHFRAYFGGSAVLDLSVGVLSNNHPYVGLMVITIAYVGASSQFISGVYAPIDASSTGQNNTVFGFTNATSAVNEALAQNVKFTVQQTSASAAQTITIEGGTIHLI